MNRALAAILISLLIQGCSENKKTDRTKVETNLPEAIDTAYYEIDGFNSGVTLALLSNYTFFYKTEAWGCMGGGGEKYTFGKYEQEENKINLIPEKVKVLSYWNEEDPFDFSKPTTTKEFLYEKDTLKIKTEYFKVNIDGKSYLLSGEYSGEFYFEDNNSNDFHELAADLKGNDQPYGKYFIARKKDSINFTIDQLPEQWKKILN
jgi:hypothetical protein